MNSRQHRAVRAHDVTITLFPPGLSAAGEQIVCDSLAPFIRGKLDPPQEQLALATVLAQRLTALPIDETGQNEAVRRFCEHVLNLLKCYRQAPPPPAHEVIALWEDGEELSSPGRMN